METTLDWNGNFASQSPFVRHLLRTSFDVPRRDYQEIEYDGEEAESSDEEAESSDEEAESSDDNAPDVEQSDDEDI